jgi:Zn-dependent protease with chaperone function
LKLGVVLIKIVNWLFISYLIVMGVSGSIYIIALLLQSSTVSSLFFALSLTLISIFRLQAYFYIPLIIGYGSYRRIRRSKSPVDPILKDRVVKLVAETSVRMKIRKPVTALIIPKWSNAGVLGRGKLFVGENLARNMDDEELTGVIGHELAHLIKHHIAVKLSMISALVILVLLSSYLTLPWANDRIVFYTIFVWVAFAESPIFWRIEYSADAKAVEILGEQPMVRALMKLRTMLSDSISYTHPRISARIRRITPAITDQFNPLS